MRLPLGFLLIALALLLPVAAFADEPAPLCPAGVESTGERALAELRGEIVALLDKAVADGSASESEAFAMKARLAAFGASPDFKPEALATAFTGLPAACEGAFAKARDKFETLVGLQGNYSFCEGHTNDNLRRRLLNIVTAKHNDLGYDGARRYLFSKLDNVNGFVTCVYTGRKVPCNGIPSATGAQSMNTEHTWPKSLGADKCPAKSDLHHLYGTDTYANNVRSSYPFGVVDPRQAQWAQGGSCFDGKVFMPREDHRGNVARSYIYFSVRYQKPINDDEERVLRRWHKEDPVTDADRARNDGIFAAQANRNPFIDRPDFVDKIDNF